MFDNGPLAETDTVMGALVQEIGLRGAPPLPVFKGCAAITPDCQNHGAA